MLDNKTESLLKKLKALADRGIGGEQLNAKVMLSKLLKKHGLEEADLEGERKGWHPVFVQKQFERLFFQVAATVLGSTITIDNSDIDDYLFIECTAAEAIEIEAKYSFYLNEFCDEINVLLDAFICKNELDAKECPPVYIDPYNLSAAERDRISRAAHMSENIRRSDFMQKSKYKQLY